MAIWRRKGEQDMSLAGQNVLFRAWLPWVTAGEGAEMDTHRGRWEGRKESSGVGMGMEQNMTFLL